MTFKTEHNNGNVYCGEVRVCVCVLGLGGGGGDMTVQESKGGTFLLIKLVVEILQAVHS